MQEWKILIPYHSSMTQPLTQVTSLLPSTMITQAQVSLLLLVIWIYLPLEAELHQVLSSGCKAVKNFFSE